MLICHTFDVAMAIRARRRQLKLRQIEVAKAAKVGREWLVDLEHGKPTVELGLVMQTLTTLGLEINLGPTEGPRPGPCRSPPPPAPGPRRSPATVRPAKRGENARRRGRPRRIAPDRNDGLRKDFRCSDTQRESAGATHARQTLDGTDGTTTP